MALGNILKCQLIKKFRLIKLLDTAIKPKAKLVGEDGDNVYFGGATSCFLLKLRHRQLKKWLRTDRNALPIQVSMLKP